MDKFADWYEVYVLEVTRFPSRWHGLAGIGTVAWGWHTFISEDRIPKYYPCGHQIVRGPKECQEEGCRPRCACGGKLWAKGMCSACYQRERRKVAA